MVTALSTVDDLLYILTQRRIIPVTYQGIYTLCYGRPKSLLGASTMASLGVGSLSHFYLRTRVCGGAGRFFVILSCILFILFVQDVYQDQADHLYHLGVRLFQCRLRRPVQNESYQMKMSGNGQMQKFSVRAYTQFIFHSTQISPRSWKPENLEIRCLQTLQCLTWAVQWDMNTHLSVHMSFRSN